MQDQNVAIVGKYRLSLTVSDQKRGVYLELL